MEKVSSQQQEIDDLQTKNQTLEQELKVVVQELENKSLRMMKLKEALCEQ